MKKLHKNEADYTSATHGTHKVGSLHGYYYNDLISAFGEPTYSPDDSGDGKVQFEWVFKFKYNIYTLYDWKTFSEKYTKNDLTTWSIGGKTEPSDFIDQLTNKLQERLCSC